MTVFAFLRRLVRRAPEPTRVLTVEEEVVRATWVLNIAIRKAAIEGVRSKVAVTSHYTSGRVHPFDVPEVSVTMVRGQ